VGILKKEGLNPPKIGNLKIPGIGGKLGKNLTNLPEVKPKNFGMKNLFRNGIPGMENGV